MELSGSEDEECCTPKVRRSEDQRYSGEEPCTVEDLECCNMKGFLSFLVLWIVKKRNMKGCEIRNELERRRGTKPSPGTLYPVLKELKEKGFIEANESKVYSLTEKGKNELQNALNHFGRLFYDGKEMFECCNISWNE